MAEETGTFGSIPRRRRSGNPATTSAVGNGEMEEKVDTLTKMSYGQVPSPTARLDSLVDVADETARLERLRGEADSKESHEDRSNKKSSPPSFAPSPPVSPVANTALAAVAAAAAANAECKTWISGTEPKTSSPRKSRGHDSDKRKYEDGRNSPEECSPSEADQDLDTGEITPGKNAERRSLRRRRDNTRFQPYHTDTTGPVFEGAGLPPEDSPRNFGGAQRSGGVAARKRLDQQADYNTSTKAPAEERKFERALEQIQLQFGKKHPEVGKALLQIARHCYARQQTEKAERYLLRSWDVFKCHADRSTNMQESFESFLSLFEDYQCSENALESVRREMFSMSPVSTGRQGFNKD